MSSAHCLARDSKGHVTTRVKANFGVDVKVGVLSDVRIRI